jgi:F-type H+-transporting ATPase subunit alpha
MICVYVSIGQKDSKLRKIQARLEAGGAMDYTVIVSAGASEAAARCPTLLLILGYLLLNILWIKVKDVLIIYDDLSKHAVAYREISLLLRRPPGREAYPGDVFYLHSRLTRKSLPKK